MQIDLLRAAARLKADSSGNIAVFFSIALLPLLFAGGAALDYSYASMARTKLNAAADSAALAAVSHDVITASHEAAQAAALAIFKADAGNIPRVNLTEVVVEVTEDNHARTAVVRYEATSPTSLLAAAGWENVPIGGRATASSSMPTYIDFYLLLDNTPSMGVAATPADISRMVANTPDQCAFACHETNAANDYYDIARNLGITMRIDVVREATQQLIARAESISTVPRQFRTALYTFGAAATNINLTRISALTTVHANARSAASAIDLMTVPNHGYNGDADTDFFRILPAISKEIANPGDGTSEAQPQKILFFVSDGLHNSLNAPFCSEPLANSNRCQMPLDASLCTTIKNRGIRVAVLYTTYLPLPTNAWYNTWVSPFQSEIADRMRSCASEGLFFEVSPSEGIAEALLALFQRAVAQAFLSR